MKERYLFVLLILFFILLSIKLFKSNNYSNYVINDFEIEEKNINDVTNLKIKNDSDVYYYLFDKKKGKNVLKNIDYYQSKDYNCVFLTFYDGSNSNDLICYKDGLNYLFSIIDNPPASLNVIYNKLISENKIKVKTDDIYNIENVDLYNIYINNVYDDLGFALTNYKGLYILNNKKIEDVKLFSNDVYEQKVKAFTENKYVIADYNQLYDFDTFYIVDLKSAKIDKIKFKYEISFNSEIIYVESDIMYLYDIDNKSYYKIDLKSKKVTLLKEKISKITKTIENYQILKETKNSYYLLKDNILYKSVDKSINQLYYMFDLSNKSSIEYDDDYICWLEEIDIKCYYKNDFNLIASNNEFSFNKTLSYKVFNIK